jgi:hypothetical protein
MQTTGGPAPNDAQQVPFLPFDLVLVHYIRDRFADLGLPSFFTGVYLGGSSHLLIGNDWFHMGGKIMPANEVFGLTPDRQAVWRYDGSGTSWTQVGGPASEIVASR